MSYFDISPLEFEKNIVLFEISILEFVLLQSLVRNQKPLNFGPKIPHLSIFGLEFENSIVIFETSPLEVL